MYEPMWPFLLTYRSYDMRLTGFLRLTVVNETPGKWGVSVPRQTTPRPTNTTITTRRFKMMTKLQKKK